jgi:hypothetical protein
MNNNFNEILQHLDSIGLDELNAYKLLNRIDTKYLCRAEDIGKLLEKAHKDFKVQEINNSRNSAYETLYFDPPELKSYFDHHQGKRIRYKIRFRKYMDTGDVFLEVKKKRNYIRTNKKRYEFDFATSLNEKHRMFINECIELPGSEFREAIWTIFDRITLIGRNHFERVTIDTNLRFRNKSSELCLPDLSIIEVKREKTEGISPFSSILYEDGIRPKGFSKYIMGNILLDPKIKHNRFKRRIVTVNKICYGTKFYR